ncbi:F-box/kelch-repeat protein At3g23880-like [Syzygium oleosum]|uniref:F-box/kelch-repeat protein At3g23880-like n=1 Tax=Syzygium oleosum TaxID=219896 RepID=UPI0011D18AE5|nr:F-box/kelch-repeat protein At3g23880-like [Syzygium oleosum]
MASFPDDITVDILLRLPVKSLARFWCVCKSWKSLLASAYFVKAHLDRSSKFRTVGLLKYDDNNSTRIGGYRSHRRELSHLDPSFGHPDRYDAVGSCNGVLCLTIYYKDNPDLSDIFIWNPSIHECMVVPQLHCHVSGLIAFGFYPLSGHLDDFKVVSISFYFGAHPDCHSSEAQIYSLRSNSWKKIGNSFPSWLDKNLGHQVVFQNFICWCPYACVDGQIVTPLVLLDTVEDASARNPSSQCYEVWTMKEFGVTESWTKLYTTTVFTNGFLQCWPLGAASFGEVLFVKCFYFGLRFCLPSHVVSYDARRSEFEEFKVEVDSDCSSQLVPYVESLVSVVTRD